MSYVYLFDYTRNNIRLLQLVGYRFKLTSSKLYQHDFSLELLETKLPGNYKNTTDNRKDLKEDGLDSMTTFSLFKINCRTSTEDEVVLRGGFTQPRRFVWDGRSSPGR